MPKDFGRTESHNIESKNMELLDMELTLARKIARASNGRDVLFAVLDWKIPAGTEEPAPGETQPALASEARRT